MCENHWVVLLEFCLGFFATAGHTFIRLHWKVPGHKQHPFFVIHIQRMPIRGVALQTTPAQQWHDKVSTFRVLGKQIGTLVIAQIKSVVVSRFDAIVHRDRPGTQWRALLFDQGLDALACGLHHHP